MLFVRVALILVAVATGVATLLGNLAERLPEATAPLPAACVPLDLPASGHLQVGYCP